jgi:GTP-binding protein YchF
MRIGIIGLPNSGKTTIFNVLTGGQAATTAYAGGSFQVNTAVVPVPDHRVDALSQMYQPQKTTYARIEYADIAGLGGGPAEAARSVSLSGELVNAIGNNDALLHVVRVFEDDTIPHPLETVDPARDIAALDAELLLSDLSKIENRLERLETSLKRGKGFPTYDNEKAEFELLSRLNPEVAQGVPLRDLEFSTQEEKRLRGFQFLTAKPALIVLNLGDEDEASRLEYPHQNSVVTAIRGRLEMDIAQLDEDEERAMFMAEYDLTELSVGRIIRQTYDLLGRMNFFTVGEEEVRAWETTQDATALECAGTVHSDLARGFIRAEVITFEDLMAAGSYAAARSKGQVRLEGKEAIIHDGDVVLVRFNV